MIRGVLQAATEHDLPIELLNPEQVAERFPMFRIEPDTVGVLEQQAGVLAVENGVLAQLKVAESTGFATTLPECALVKVIHRSRSVVVETNRGEFECSQLIVTAGAWVKSLLQGANFPLTVMRQVQHWFQKPVGQDEELPVFLYETEQGAFYGLAEEPSGYGWKVSQHYGAPELQHPDEVDWSVSDVDVRPVREFLHRHMPDVDPTPLASEVCQYTLTPNRHFLIDRLPGQPNVTVACGFSGHGYKFAPVVGELLSDLAFNNASPWHAAIFQRRAHV
jgi:glycine/D-amino acid oxidase-like deaminating enzyme